MAQFERSLISGQSPYDQEFHYKIEGSMSDDAIKGKALFESSRTNCSTCHSGFNFTNYQFENNGLYEEYEDLGRAKLTQTDADIARFKVPSLRNVAITGPYMHDGSMNSLEEVINHYNEGGKGHFNQSSKIRPLELSDSEQEYLLAFLQALTDDHFIENENLTHE